MLDVVADAEGFILLHDDGDVKGTTEETPPPECCCEEESSSSAVPCNNCTGTAPAAWLVEFDGVAEGTCGDCADFNNTTFRLERFGDDACYWRVNIDLCLPEGIVSAYIEVRMQSGMQLQVVNESSGGIPAPARWTDSDQSCETIHNPTFLFQSGVLTCNFSGATATVTPSA